MNYYIGQALGVISAICCIVMPMWKRKWQMLVTATIVNLTSALNLVFLGELGSACIINLVATLQVLISLWHVRREKPVSRLENVIFCVAYVALGCISWKEPLDVLPIIGIMIYMFQAFQRDEQKSRMLTLSNSLVFLAYYLLIGSTVVLAELFAAVSSAIALIKYRKR